MDRPVLLCGLGKVGRCVLDVLRAAHMPVVVIDMLPEPPPLGERVQYLRGDFRQPNVLEAAGVRQCRGIVVCASDDLANITAALTVRSLAPGTRIVVRVFNANLVSRLGRNIENVVALSVSSLTAPLIALTALTGDILGAFPLDDGPRQVAQLTVTADSPLAGLGIAEAGEQFRLTALAHLPTDGKPRFLLDLDGAAVLRPGDRFAVAGAPRDLNRFRTDGDQRNDFDDILWAGKFRRLGRIVGRTLAEIDLAVKVCTSVLLLVIVGSTLVFHLAGGIPWAPALVRTVRAIATAADLDADRLPDWEQVYVSALRLTGLVLTAAFTAIFTQYLLRAKLGGALEARRIPEAGTSSSADWAIWAFAWPRNF